MKLDLPTSRLVLFTDFLFENVGNGKSEMGFVLVLVDGTGNSNMLH